MVEGLLNGPLASSFWLWQVKICSLIPLCLLTVLIFLRLKDSWYIPIAALVSAILLLQVFIMRWNVVIGGQLMSKSARGYVEFHPHWFGREGIIAVIAVMVVPFVILFILGRIFPFWSRDAG
jgi:predicted membrane protein